MKTPKEKKKPRIYSDFHQHQIVPRVKAGQLTPLKWRPTYRQPDFVPFEGIVTVEELLARQFLQRGPMTIRTLACHTGYSERAIRDLLKLDRKREKPRFTLMGRLKDCPTRRLNSNIWGFTRNQAHNESRHQGPFRVKVRTGVGRKGVTWTTTKNHHIDHHDFRSAEVDAAMIHATRLANDFFKEKDNRVVGLADPFLRRTMGWGDPNIDREIDITKPLETGPRDFPFAPKEKPGDRPRVGIADGIVLSSQFRFRDEFQMSRLSPSKLAAKMALCPGSDPLLFFVEHDDLFPRDSEKKTARRKGIDFTGKGLFATFRKVMTSKMRPEHEDSAEAVLCEQAQIEWAPFFTDEELPRDASRLLYGENLNEYEAQWKRLVEMVLATKQYAGKVSGFLKPGPFEHFVTTLATMEEAFRKANIYDYFATPLVDHLPDSDIRVRAKKHRDKLSQNGAKKAEQQSMPKTNFHAKVALPKPSPTSPEISTPIPLPTKTLPAPIAPGVDEMKFATQAEANIERAMARDKSELKEMAATEPVDDLLERLHWNTPYRVDATEEELEMAKAWDREEYERSGF